MRPRRAKCHHGPCYRCLLGGRLIGLAFDPLAHREGWGGGVMRAPTATLPFVPNSFLSLEILPSSLPLPPFIYPFCCYISLTVLFPNQVPPKNLSEVWFCEV